LLPWRHRELIWQFGRRDVLGRYRGAGLGVAWALLTPLALLAVYTVVFRHVFNARWGHGYAESNLDFALNLFAGLLVFQWAADLWSRAPRLILEQANLVTKVVFPLPVLVWSAALAGAFQLLVSLAVWLAACIYAGYRPDWSWLALPLPLVCLLPCLLGLSWALASLGVFLRDIGQVIGLLITALLFLSPVFYPVTALPEWLRLPVERLPLTAPIEALRAIVLLGRWPAPEPLLGLFASGLLLAALGLALMRRLQPGFADVL
jgi:lipopolysaccharide transport system permease protein